MSRSPADVAESLKLEARMRFLNAGYHAAEVRTRFGFYSPEYVVANAVVEGARAEFLKACERLVDIYAGQGSAREFVRGGMA